jgi:hypothetical protein
MKKIITFMLLLSSTAMAIMNISLDDPYEGLMSNSIIELVYDSTGMWIGSAGGASYRADGDLNWTTFTGESGLISTELSAMAASRYNDTTLVCIATLHTEYASGQNVPFGDGFSITKNHGDTWLSDTLTTPFHANYYGMLAYDLDIYKNDIYAACFYGGLVRSMNGGYTWDNLYLNSSDSSDLADSSYQSYSNRYFSVKVDLSLYPDTISVWGGSAAGLNRFVFTSFDDISKQNAAWAIAHRETDIEGSLPGNHVVALAVHGRPGRIYDAFIDSNYAYIAHDYEGMIVVNVSDSTNPVEVGRLDTDGRAWAVYVVDTLAYIADYNGDLVVANISDPNNPEEAGSASLPDFRSRAVNVFVNGGYVYVADEIYGLHIFNADPNNLDLINSYGDFGGINDVYVEGIYAYLAAAEDGMIILGITDVDNLEMIGQFEIDTLSNSAEELNVQGDVAFIADSKLGLLAIDIADPANPEFIDDFETPGAVNSICFANNRIFLTDGSDLRVFTLADETHGDSLQYINGITTPGMALNVAVSGDLAYVADNYFGMQIIDISQLDSMAIEGNFAPVCSTYIWAACRVGVGEDGQRYGVAYSPNYGQTWKTVIEEPAWDFAFIGDTVIVATDNGLYVSADYTNWHIITQLEERNEQDEVVLRYFPSGFYALEAVGSGLWVGGADGTAYTDHLTLDNSETWDIHRSQINPEDHYAYPSPFSPLVSTRQGTTIHYMPPQTTDVTIKVYDFNLDLVSVVVDGVARDGGVEVDNDVWDGRNDKGEVVANGIYFYNIKLGTGEDWWGKVAVVK